MVKGVAARQYEEIVPQRTEWHEVILDLKRKDIVRKTLEAPVIECIDTGAGAEGLSKTMLILSSAMSPIATFVWQNFGKSDGK